MNSVLTANNLSKQYKSRTIVDKVSLEINNGEIIGLLGPNGAGKTTCFYMILGLVPADQGNIILNQQNITTKPIHLRAKLGIGYLPQEASVFRKLTVEQNILGVLQCQPALKRNKRQQHERLEQLLAEFRISHVRKTLGLALSGGERRRLEIARTLAANPSFVLLDEPFAGVDPISIGEIKTIISYLSNKNIGIIITDHNVRDTLDICHRAYILNNGKIICAGNANEILANKEVRQVYLGEKFML